MLLGFVGTLMLIEAVRAHAASAAPASSCASKLPNQHNWIHGLPLRIRFKKSKLYISVLPVLALGLLIGFVGSLLGIGGGFILVPALVYLLRVPGNVVIGTSLLQVVAMMAATTILHALSSQSVDILLAFCLMVGGTVGAQFGASAGKYLRGEQLRALLALLVLAVAIRFGLTPGPRAGRPVLDGGARRRGASVRRVAAHLPLLLAAMRSGAGRAAGLDGLAQPRSQITSSFDGETLTLFGNIEPECRATDNVVDGPLPRHHRRHRAAAGPGGAPRRPTTSASGSTPTRCVFKAFPVATTMCSPSGRLTTSPTRQRWPRPKSCPSEQARLAARSAAGGSSSVFGTRAGAADERERAISASTRTACCSSPTPPIRRSVTLPSDVANGPFIAHTYVFKDGEMIAERAEGFSVRKIGFERFLFIAARSSRCSTASSA